jgi:hypothetical protein
MGSHQVPSAGTYFTIQSRSGLHAKLTQTANNFTDSLEILLDAYEQIGEHLPLLQEYEALFHHSPHMIQSLELMYIDILQFHQDAMRFFSGKRKSTPTV